MGCQCMSTSKPIRCDEKRAWGPLHTRAKSGDNEIVRAQKKCLKAISRHFQIHVLWWWTLKCSVKSYVIGCSTKCYFNGFSIHVRSSHKINIVTPRLWGFEVPWFPSIVLGLPSDHGTWSLWCYVRLHVDLTSILHSLTRWSLKRSVKRTWTGSAFSHQWECLKCNGHRPSVSCVKWPWECRAMYTILFSGPPLLQIWFEETSRCDDQNEPQSLPVIFIYSL